MSPIHPSGTIAVWVALILYAISLALQTAGRWDSAKWAWKLGALAFAIHFVVAMGTVYGWSLAVAFRETAIDTEALTGVRSGHGLWLNYLFFIIWTTDAAFWAFAGTQRYRERARWIPISLHSFMLFMIFNGAVVFVNGPRRWLGAFIFTFGITALSMQFRRSKQRLS